MSVLLVKTDVRTGKTAIAKFIFSPNRPVLTPSRNSQFPNGQLRQTLPQPLRAAHFSGRLPPEKKSALPGSYNMDERGFSRKLSIISVSSCHFLMSFVKLILIIIHSFIGKMHCFTKLSCVFSPVRANSKADIAIVR